MPVLSFATSSNFLNPLIYSKQSRTITNINKTSTYWLNNIDNIISFVSSGRFVKNNILLGGCSANALSETKNNRINNSKSIFAKSFKNILTLYETLRGHTTHCIRRIDLSRVDFLVRFDLIFCFFLLLSIDTAIFRRCWCFLRFFRSLLELAFQFCDDIRILFRVLNSLKSKQSIE